jgi:hypothetical protein
MRASRPEPESPPQHAAPAVDVRDGAAGGPTGGLMQQLGLASLGSRLEQRLASLGIRLPGPRPGQDDPLAPFTGGPARWLDGDGMGRGLGSTRRPAASTHAQAGSRLAQRPDRRWGP